MRHYVKLVTTNLEVGSNLIIWETLYKKRHVMIRAHRFLSQRNLVCVTSYVLLTVSELICTMRRIVILFS